MAKGVQLATAYVSLNVNTDDLGKQIKRTFTSMERQGTATGTRIGQNMSRGIRGAMSGGGYGPIFRPMEIAGVRWAVKAGAAVGRALRTAIITGVTAGVGAALLGAGAALAAGLDRLKTLQRAEVQLSLKLSPQEIKQVKTDITKVVEGTPISLDAALQAVPKAINAGLRGGELSQYIKDVADLTAATGGQASFQQLDIILSQIRSKSKLTGEEMAQLIDAGVDVRGMLKETFNWDDNTLNQMLKNNRVGIKELQKATQQLYGQDGGLAKKMGETFDGAVGNFKASVARLGANILDVIFGSEDGDDPLSGAVDGVTALTEKLDDAGAWIAANKGEIRGYFDGAKKTAMALAGAIKSVVDLLGDFKRDAEGVGSAISRGFQSAQQTVSGWWNNAKDKLGRFKDNVAEIFNDLKDKFNEFFGPNGWIAEQFNKLGRLVDKVRDILGLGPATANAAAPGGGTTPFNPGPMAPAVAAGQAPLGGSTMGLSSVPAFGFDENGNPLVSGSGGGFNPGPMKSGGLTARMPTQSAVGSAIYSGPVTEDTGGSVEPRNALVQDLIKQQFGDSGAWIGNDYRKPDGYNEHSSGQAADIMISELGKRTEEGIALGNRVNKWLLANAEKIGLQYTIWNGMLYRPDGTTSPNPGNGVTGNHEDHVHYRVKPGAIQELPQFAGGGKVYGAGTGTSDSIPAMLSNGEHVLTAKDVSAMGGQDGVYAFRAALQAGMIPGFNVGGAVDPNVVQDAADNVADLNKQYEIAQQRQREVLDNPDASDGERLQAEISAAQAWRAARQAEADLPIIQSGGTPPDRSPQNALQAAEDELRLSRQALTDLNTQEGVPYSQRMQANNRVAQAVRERDQLLSASSGETDYLGEFVRSAGFSPTAAANTGVAGTSSLSAVFSSANEVVGGLIDTGASLAQTAVSAAITAGAAAGTFGAGAAAAPAASGAASYGIQLGAAVGKRLSAFGFQLGAIGADALVAQAMPFGAPRWLGYDYTNFAPQLGIQQAALTTLEKAGTDAINARFAPQNQGAPPQPQMQTPGAEPVATPDAAPQPAAPFGTILQQGDPGFYNPPPEIWPFNPNGAGGGGGGGSWAQGGAVKVYDEGGVLKPGDLALNASTRPEKILTQKQWDSLAKLSPSGNSGPMVKIDAIYGLSPEDVASQIESKQKLAMMRYAGRP